jgi:hypothetical protein
MPRLTLHDASLIVDTALATGRQAGMMPLTVGALGISGDTSDKDEYCAITGIRAAGLRSDPAEPAPGWAGSTP